MKVHMPAVCALATLSCLPILHVYSFTSNNFIKHTFIKYQYLFNDKKIIAKQNVACITSAECYNVLPPFFALFKCHIPLEPEFSVLSPLRAFSGCQHE